MIIALIVSASTVFIAAIVSGAVVLSQWFDQRHRRTIHQMDQDHSLVMMYEQEEARRRLAARG